MKRSPSSHRDPHPSTGARHDRETLRIAPALCRLCLGMLLVLAAFLPRTPIGAGAHAATRGSAMPEVPDLGPARDSDPRFGAVQAFQAPRDAAMIGVRWERVTFWWKEMQPDGPDSWNPFATDHDRQIDAEVRAGRQVVGELINTPDWAAADPAQHGDSVPKGLYLPYNDPHNYWGHFVGLMARHYAGRIDDWIIWNEVTIPRGQWHTWAGSRADYARLVEVAYQAARAANPHARIILAGDPYWYDLGAWFADLLHRLTIAPGARANHDYFDAANLHLYGGCTGFARIIGWYRATMARYGLDKPIWIAETNAIPYNDPARRLPRTGFYASLDDQASYVVDAFATALALGVQRIEINRMTDGADFAAGGVPFGLVRDDGTVRPAFYAYRAAALLFAGVTGGNIAVDRRTGVYTVTLHKPGAIITVAWDQQPVPASVAVAATAASARLYDKFGHERVVTPVGGAYRLALAAATGNTDPGDPHDYVIGGSPIIVVQAAAR